MKKVKEIAEEEKPPSSKPLHITILYNRVFKKTDGLTIDQIPDKDTLTSALHIDRGLKKAGFKTSIFAVTPQSFLEIPNIETDLFFNSCFGIGNLPKTESQIPEILDKNNRLYTGGNGQNILLTTNKMKTKELLFAKNLPTAKGKIFENPKQVLPRFLKFPLIVKPSEQDASLGICNDAVVENRKQLEKRIAHINKWYREPALAEEFIDGREFNVSVLGNDNNLTVLPISEIIFGNIFSLKGAKKRWRIVSFAAKWLKYTKAYKETVGTCPAPLSKDKEKEIRELAKQVFRLTNCRDYARIDLRMKEDGSLYILEINTNPSLDNEAGVGFVHSAASYGMDYPQLLNNIVQCALTRYQIKDIALKQRIETVNEVTVNLPQSLTP